MPRRPAPRPRRARARWPLAALAITVALVGAPVVPAAAGPTSDTPTVRRIHFPVAGSVRYSNDWGSCRGTACSRSHEGNDLMGARRQKLLAAKDGRITFVRRDASGTSGNMVILTDDAGWRYYYIHLNNDTPGTDDGANPQQWILAPGVDVGTRVRAGQHIAYLGDSGNAEGTSPHLHFELHRPDAVAVNPWYSLRLAQGLPAGPWCRFPTNPTPTPTTTAGPGYWLVTGRGDVRAYGAAPRLGTPGSVAGTVVGAAPTPTGRGYWLVTDRGGVYSYGDAAFHGSTGGRRLNAPIVGITATASGRGYWLFARDGGVFSYGDARFYGSTGAMRLNAPVIGMVATTSGHGYWLFARDGGVFSYGDARFFGSTGGLRLARPVVAMVPAGHANGYLLLGADGGTFAFGAARFHGSLPGEGLCSAADARAMAPTRTGGGYWILQTDGRVRAYGDARHHGDAPGLGAIALLAFPG